MCLNKILNFLHQGSFCPKYTLTTYTLGTLCSSGCYPYLPPPSLCLCKEVFLELVAGCCHFSLRAPLMHTIMAERDKRIMVNLLFTLVSQDHKKGDQAMNLSLSLAHHKAIMILWNPRDHAWTKFPTPITSGSMLPRSCRWSTTYRKDCGRQT